MRMKIKFDCEAIVDCKEPLTKQDVGLALERMQDEPLGKFVTKVSLVMIEVPATHHLNTPTNKILEAYIAMFKKAQKNVSKLQNPRL